MPRTDGKHALEVLEILDKATKKLKEWTDEWVESVELFKLVKKKIDALNNISFKPKAQVEDSSFSVSSNIAEGYSRRFIKENIQFNNIALSSLAKTIVRFLHCLILRLWMRYGLMNMTQNIIHLKTNW
jgi:four helix bundle protein